MIRKFHAVLLAALSFVSAPTMAQSSATPVLPGLLVTSGCPSGVSACWVPYSNTNPLPVTGGGGGGGTTMTATAAAPSYVEGSSTNPLSSNLTGDLRTIAKQSGTWNITNVSGTVSLPTNAAQETGGNLATIATQQTAASTAVGAPADAVCGTATGTCSLIALSKYNNSSPLPAGSNIIGNVRIDQTTPGTTNGVVATGNVANGAADSGNPVKIGCVYSTSGTLTGLTVGNRGDVQCDIDSNVRVLLTGNAGTPASTGTNVVTSFSRLSNSSGSGGVLGVLDYMWDGTNTRPLPGDANGLVSQPAISSTFWGFAGATGGIVSSTADVVLKSAAGASVRNYLSAVQIATDTLGAATEIVIKDGSTIIWRGKLQTTSMGETNYTFNPPLRGTANTALNIAALTSVTGGIYVNAQGYTGS